jgi:hypothetical protein
MRFCYYLVVSLLLLSLSGDAHAQQQQYRPAPVYRPAPRVYRPAPVYRSMVPNRPQVVRPPTAHGPLNAGPHPVHPVTHLHSYAHGTGPHWHHHGHFYNGSWVSDPADPPYEGDDDAPDDDVGEDADEAPAPSGGGAQYGAIAVGRINGNVSSGWATRGSQAEADSAAVNTCGQAQGASCSVVHRSWHGGCGYVAIADDDQGDCAGWSNNPNVAVGFCQRGGCGCKAPIGGCTSP